MICKTEKYNNIITWERGICLIYMSKHRQQKGVLGGLDGAPLLFTVTP